MRYRDQYYLKTFPDSVMLAGAVWKESVFPLADLAGEQSRICRMVSGCADELGKQRWGLYGNGR